MIYRTRLLINTHKPSVRAGIREKKKNKNNNENLCCSSLSYFFWLKSTFKDSGKPFFLDSQINTNQVGLASTLPERREKPTFKK